MSHVSKTPFDLTLHLVSIGGNSDGGWIPGNGYPNPQVGRIGQRYVDVQTGHIYGPKSRDGWPAEYTHTLNLGNVAGEFANMLSRVPALEVRATNLEARTTVLEGRADSAADLAIQHHATLQEHGLRIETLEADSFEVRRRIGMVDTSLSARMLAAEDSLNELSRQQVGDLADTISRLDTLTTELNGNKSSLTELQESYTSMSQTWTQQVITLRSEFEDNTATLQQTLRTHADMFSATSELITTLTSRVDDNQAAITTESRTRSDTVSALAEQITRLSAETTSSSAALTSQQTAMANELEAYASSVLALNAQIGENSASFQEEIQTLTDADQALARRVSTLDVASEELSGRITSEESARIRGDSAVLTSAKQLVATSESGTAVKIAQEAAARLSGDQAEAYQRSLLDTKFTNQGQTLQAAITAEATARSNAIAAETSSRNQQISTFNTSLGNVSAAVTQEANTRASVDGYLGSRYTLSVTNSGGGYASVAGMEIANTSSGGRQITNHIAFFADRFYIAHGSSTASSAPFEVVGGRVYIKSAVIQDASITNAKIGTAEVSTLKIAGNAVTVPVGGTGNGSFPTYYLNMPVGGTIIVIVSGNYLAPKGSSHTSVYLSAVCNGIASLSVGISLPFEMSGSSVAVGSFPVGPGVHSVTGIWSTDRAPRTLHTTSVVAFGAQR